MASEHRQRAILRVGVLSVVVLSPLPFGSVEPWAVLAIELAAALLGLWTLWILFNDRSLLPVPARGALVAALLLVAVGVVQLLPLPAGVVRVLAPETAQVRLDVAEFVPEIGSGAAPLSIAPSSTLDAVLRLSAYVLIGLSAAVAFRRRRHLRMAVGVLMVVGAFQALYGTAEYVSGHQHIFGYAKKHYLDSATGTLINRNHFAGYLAILLPFGASFLLAQRLRLSGANGVRQKVVRLLEPAGTYLALSVLAVLGMWAGVFLSFSRGGLVAALAGTLAFPILAGLGRRKWLVAILSLAFPAAVFLMWQDVTRAPGDRLVPSGGRSLPMENRLLVWRDTAKMIPDHPVFGSGYGTFEAVFERYRSPEIRGRWNHAHNDWLQLQVEGGFVALAAMLALVAMWMWSNRRRIAEENGSVVLFRAAAMIGVVVAMIHALVDFPLRIPAVAVLLAFIVGAFSGEVYRPPSARVISHGKTQ